jgi:hypothetical protein
VRTCLGHDPVSDTSRFLALGDKPFCVYLAHAKIEFFVDLGIRQVRLMATWPAMSTLTSNPK